MDDDRQAWPGEILLDIDVGLYICRFRDISHIVHPYADNQLFIYIYINPNTQKPDPSCQPEHLPAYLLKYASQVGRKTNDLEQVRFETIRSSQRNQNTRTINKTKPNTHEQSINQLTSLPCHHVSYIKRGGPASSCRIYANSAGYKPYPRTDRRDGGPHQNLKGDGSWTILWGRQPPSNLGTIHPSSEVFISQVFPSFLFCWTED